MESVAPLTNSPEFMSPSSTTLQPMAPRIRWLTSTSKCSRSARTTGLRYRCDRGWESGTAPFVLFLNPDARIEVESVQRLVEALNRNPGTGLVGPRILDADGALDFSQRRFPRLRSTYSQALFLHRVFPRASWSDEVIREPNTYGSGHTAEWLSGACMLVTREALQRIGGWNGGRSSSTARIRSFAAGCGTPATRCSTSRPRWPFSLSAACRGPAPSSCLRWREA